MEYNNNNNNNIKNKRISIIGGGPASLGLARMLQLGGCENVTVYERDIDRYVRIMGSSLDLHPESGLLFIKKAKLEQEFKMLSRPEGASFTVTNKDGVNTLRVPHIKCSAYKPEIDRGVLRDMLIDSLKPDTIKFDHHFKSLKELKDGTFEIEFKCGKKIISDLVIGADGANSKVRPYVNENLKPVYSGTVLIEFEISNPLENCKDALELVDNGSYVALGSDFNNSGSAFMMQLKGDGSLIVYCCTKKPEDWHKKEMDFNNTEMVLDYIKNQIITSDWNPIYHKVLDNISTKFIPRPLYTIPCRDNQFINNPWTTNKLITLVGDAAHVIVPFQGAGVNCALLDAIDLSESLLNQNDNDTSILSRLNQYELKMQKRMLKEATESLNVMDLFLSGDDAGNNFNSYFFGNKFKYLVPYIPKIINLINYITDIFNYIFK